MTGWIGSARRHPSALLLAAQLLGVLVTSVLHAAFYFYTAYALIPYMFTDERVTRDELYATGATFTVVAWAFASPLRSRHS